MSRGAGWIAYPWVILALGILEVFAAGSVARGGQWEWGRWFGIFLFALVLYGLVAYGGKGESLNA